MDTIAIRKHQPIMVDRETYLTFKELSKEEQRSIVQVVRRALDLYLSMTSAKEVVR